MMLNIYKKIILGFCFIVVGAFQQSNAMVVHGVVHRANDAAFIQAVINVMDDFDTLSDGVQEIYEKSFENEMAAWVAFGDFDDDTLPQFIKECYVPLLNKWSVLSEQDKNKWQVADALNALSFVWINVLWNVVLLYGVWDAPDLSNYKRFLSMGERFMLPHSMIELHNICKKMGEAFIEIDLHPELDKYKKNQYLEEHFDAMIASLDYMKQRIGNVYPYGQRVFTETVIDDLKEKMKILQQECSLPFSRHHVEIEKSIVPRLFDLSE